MRALLAIALVGIAGSALAGDLVVIQSTAPRYAAGTVIAEGQAIELDPGHHAVLVGPTGRTLRLNGPYHARPEAGADKGDERLVAALASLFRPRAEQSGTVGAVRAADAQWRAQNIRDAADVLAIDPMRGGRQCLTTTDAARAEMVRSPLGSPRRINVLGVETGAAAAFDWPGGARRVAWPAQVPIADRHTYLVEHADLSGVTQITLRIIPSQMPSDVHRAAALAEAGCDAQARLMIVLISGAAR